MNRKQVRMSFAWEKMACFNGSKLGQMKGRLIGWLLAIIVV